MKNREFYNEKMKNWFESVADQGKIYPEIDPFHTVFCFAEGVYSLYEENINGGSVVNFRLYPGMKTKVLKTLPVGTQVTVLEMGENWSLVEIDGQQGYVSTYFLKF